MLAIWTWRTTSRSRPWPGHRPETLQHPVTLPGFGSTACGRTAPSTPQLSRSGIGTVIACLNCSCMGWLSWLQCRTPIIRLVPGLSLLTALRFRCIFPQELQGNADDNAYSVSFSPSGLHLAAAFYGRALRIWSLHSNGTVADRIGQLISTDGEDESWFKVAWSPSGDRLACGTDQGIIYVWTVLGNGTISAAEGRQKLSGHTDPVYSVAWAPSGAALASGSSDNTVRLWHVREDGSVKSEATQVLKGHSDLVLEVAWSPSSELLASGSGDRSIRVWPVNATTGLADVSGVQVLYGHADYVGTVRFSPAGDVLASGSDDTTIKLWPVHNNSTIGSVSSETISAHTDWIRCLDWNPMGTKIASAGSYDHSVRVFSILSVEQLRRFFIDTFPTTNFTLTPQEIFTRNVPRQLQEIFPEHPLPR